MNVLIADDERDMLKILSAYFEKAGFTPMLAHDGEEALDFLYRFKFALAILDWMMPKMNGLEVCREIKRHHSDTKMIMLTSKSEHTDELNALTVGADDYIRKPFHPGILITRAKKLIRQEQRIYFHDICLDKAAQKVYKHNIDLHVTKTEYELLCCLNTHKGHILSRTKLLDLVWGFDYVGEERTVDTHIRRLREKIGETVIKTHRGLGYSLEDPHE